MAKIAFLFSGQGAQHPGMAKDLYAQNASVRALFDRAEQLRNGTLAQMFEGDAETLRATENTQPCLYLADFAPAAVLAEAGVRPAGVAGFSLGELPALAFAGAIDPAEGFSLTVRRGELMGQATRERKSSMVAVIKLDNETVERLCAEFDEVYPVNYNSAGNLSVAGEESQLAAFSERVKQAGGRALPLKVAGGFHSPFMDDAAKRFADVLQKTNFASPRLPVYANYDASPYAGPVADTLRRQMNHPVRWEQTVLRMAADGFDTFVETGVGNVLAKLVTRILPDAKVYTAETAEDCAKVADEVGSHV